ncbi:MAG: fatty acid desaturase [Halioglobus sp.]
MDSKDILDQQARLAAKSRMGDFAWPTVVLGLMVTAGYVSVPLLFVSGHVSALVAFSLLMVFTYAAYTVLHESVHGSISGSHGSLRWVNEMMGYCAAWILMIPLTAHRHEHLAHHRNTNVPDSDPDHLVSDMTRSPFHALRAAVRILCSQYHYYVRERWSAAPRSQNIRFCLEVAAIVLLRLALIGQGESMEVLVLLALGSLGGVMIVMYLFAYIVHKPHETVGRYVDTSTIAIPGAVGKCLTVLWGYQNYHSIHHLFPRVPFYRYRELFEEIEGIMVEKGAPIYELRLPGLRPSSVF